MKIRNILQKTAVFTLLLFLFSYALPPAAAQNYQFAVPEMILQAYIQPDASVEFVYDITFLNMPGGRTIDIVDIGMPHDDYDIGNMSASINGAELTVIRPSEFVDPGVEIHLRGNSIPSDAEATLTFTFTMPDMVYQDTTRQDYASFQITPTWFDSQFVRGTSDIWVVVHMLPEIEPDEVLHQGTPFTEKMIFNETAVVGWNTTQPATGPFLVGTSFPQRGMDRVVTMSAFELAVKWVEDNPNVRLIGGILAVVMLTFLFFRFSGGTGFSVYFILLAILIFALSETGAALLLSVPVLLFGIGSNEYFLSSRKDTYLPALAHVEGGGIKRGLTAPEAAMLLESPLNKVLMLVIFGLLKKRVLEQVEAEPLQVALSSNFDVTEENESSLKVRNKVRRKMAQNAGVVLHSYEHDFLEAIAAATPKQPVHKIDFGPAMKGLVEHVAKRVSGFDIKETKTYYQRIIERAMREAQSTVGDLPQWEEAVDRNMEWILMGDGYETVFNPGPHTYRPIWMRRGMAAGMGSSGGTLALPGGGAGSGPGRPGGTTSFGDVAASFAGWTENTMGQLASSISPTSLNPQSAGGGVINLSGADKLTGDILRSMAESSGGSGGSSGGCACAGCACACACAGGGR
ncbi:MAG: hypothetical protein R6X32_17990 [Chloroflexota bacterium]